MLVTWHKVSYVRHEKRDDDRCEGGAGGTGAARPDRAQAIHEAAWRRFARGGFDTVGLGEIATDAGLARSTVQGYVGSKRALYRWCLDRAAGDLEAALAGAVAGADRPEARLRAALTAFVSFAADHREAWALLGRHLLASSGPFATEAADLRARLVPALERVLLGDDGGKGGGSVGSAVLGSRRVLTDPETGPPADPAPVLVDRLFDLVWSGVAAELRAAGQDP